MKIHKAPLYQHLLLVAAYLLLQAGVMDFEEDVLGRDIPREDITLIGLNAINYALAAGVAYLIHEIRRRLFGS